MLHKLAGTGFLVILGVVLVTWIWGLSDDLAVVQTDGGHCQIANANGERFSRIEDRHNPTDVDKNDTDEYLYLTLGKYEATTEVINSIPIPTYTACRILIPNPTDTNRTDLYPNVQADNADELTLVAIYDLLGTPTNQGKDSTDELTQSDATPTVEALDYFDLGIRYDNGTPVPDGIPIPNIRIANATWQDQPDIFDRDTAVGRLISQSTELYSIMAFAAVGGVGLAYFFKRRRPNR